MYNYYYNILRLSFFSFKEQYEERYQNTNNKSIELITINKDDKKTKEIYIEDGFFVIDLNED